MKKRLFTLLVSFALTYAVVIASVQIFVHFGPEIIPASQHYARKEIERFNCFDMNAVQNISGAWNINGNLEPHLTIHFSIPQPESRVLVWGDCNENINNLPPGFIRRFDLQKEDLDYYCFGSDGFNRRRGRCNTIYCAFTYPDESGMVDVYYSRIG